MWITQANEQTSEPQAHNILFLKWALSLQITRTLCGQLVTKSRAKRWIWTSWSVLIRMLLLFWVTRNMNYLWSAVMSSDQTWIKPRITRDSVHKMYQLRPFYLETTSNNSWILSKPPTKSRNLRRVEPELVANSVGTKSQRSTYKSTSNDNGSLQISTTGVPFLSKTTGKIRERSKKTWGPPSTRKRRGQELNTNNNGLIKLDRLQVSSFESNVDNLKLYLSQQVQSFEAGKIRTCYSMWQELTSDPDILNEVKGLNIDFITSPWQGRAPNQRKFSPEESRIKVESEINKLLVKGGIIPNTHQNQENLFVPFFSEQN